MGRFMPAVACFLVSFDCYRMGAGYEPQTFFAPENAWAWLFFALIWFMAGTRTMLNGVE